MRRLALCLLTLVLGGTALAVVPAAPAGAVATVTVTSTVDSTFLPRATSLREAIELAEQGDDPTTIVLAANATYRLTLCGTTDTRGDLDVNGTAGTVVIQGNGATIEQTCPGERVIDHAGPRLTLRQVTVRGGDVTGDGGGIRSTSTLTLERTVVTANSATGDGGGIRSANVILTDSRVLTNDAGGNGGGIHSSLPVASPSGVTLTRSEVRDNEAAGEGGGVDVAGTIAMNRAAVVLNRAGSTGGVDTLLADLLNSTIADNAETGGASPFAAVDLDLGPGGVTARFSTIRGGPGDGGALRSPSGLRGTGLAVDAGDAGSACGSDTDDDELGAGSNASDDDSCGFDDPSDRVGVPLLLAASPDLNGGPTRSLLPQRRSPLLDGAASCHTVTVDQRGRTRPIGPACDIGAAEVRLRIDAALRTTFPNGPLTGDGVINTTGLGQTVTLGGTSSTRRVFGLVLQNESEIREPMLVRGPAFVTGFRIRYRTPGGADVTGEVTGDGFTTGAMKPGSGAPLFVDAFPLTPSGRGTVLLRASSITQPLLVDVVRAVAVRRN